MLKSLYKALVDSIFPPRCPLCQTYINRQGAWCQTCYQKVVYHRRLPLSARYFSVLQTVRALCHYQAGIKKLIHEIKYQHRFTHLAHIHFILETELAACDFEQYDLFVPVPLHQQRLQERGFNQTTKIFEPWALRYDYTWLECLERQRDTAPQYKLSIKQRQANIAKSFQLKRDVTVRGKRILLLDDIFTTGSTLYNCALVLKKAGAASVNALVLASDA